MTGFLDSELIRKYFGCGKVPPCSEAWCQECTAQAILRGMEEPLKHGEKFILLSNDCGREIKVQEYVQDLAALGPIHPLFLRLPDRFQTSSEEKEPEMIEKWKHDAWMREALMRRGQPPPTAKNPIHFEARCPSCDELLKHDCKPAEPKPIGGCHCEHHPNAEELQKEIEAQK